MASRDHWEEVWSGRRPEEVSWYQQDPTVSQRLVERVSDPTAGVVDVGGGASRLVDTLLSAGYDDLTVIDIAAESMAAARRRLGDEAGRVRWLEGDVTRWDFGRRFDLWHDRAVFHFLVDGADRRRYLSVLRDSVAVGGHVVIATFGPDGPERCSGLPVRRYDRAAMQEALGDGFESVEYVEELHQTPAGAGQGFLYGLFRRTRAVADPAPGRPGW